jgi:hypothetical protein
MTTNAQAQVIDNWSLNLSLANGVANGGVPFVGLTDVDGIDDITVDGGATIIQTLLNGNPDNQPFSESGSLNFVTANPEGGGLGTPLTPFGTALGTANALYLDFSGLTGTFIDPDNVPQSGDERITFDPGAGTIRLILDLDGVADNGDDQLVIATFEIMDPSGGSNIDFFGGANPTGTIDVTLQIVSQICSGGDCLFEDENGDPLLDPFTVALVNVNALIDPNVNPNPTTCTPDAITGLCDSTLVVRNSGQFNLAAVPEPKTLGLMGLGLVFLGALARRGLKKEEKAC